MITRRVVTCFVVLGVVFLGACQSATRATSSGTDVVRVLDDFHDAASKAQFDRYFAQLEEDSVFLGTDPKERWTKAQFAEYCRPYFDKGQGWTYVPVERHVEVIDDFAWFDEVLRNEKYGLCRGSGVLRRERGSWRIKQYNLAFLVPNENADAVVGVWSNRTGW